MKFARKRKSELIWTRFSGENETRHEKSFILHFRLIFTRGINCLGLLSVLNKYIECIQGGRLETDHPGMYDILDNRGGNNVKSFEQLVYFGSIILNRL